jgi:26S proteasome regulatory subunit N9
VASVGGNFDSIFRSGLLCRFCTSQRTDVKSFFFFFFSTWLTTPQKNSELYHNFIASFENKLAPVRRAQLAAACAVATTDAEVAATFLDAVLGKFDKSEHAARALIHVALAEVRLRQSQPKEAKSLLAQAKALLDNIQVTPGTADGAADSAVPAAYYRALAALHKSRSDAFEFYAAALQYLAHEPVDSIPPATQVELATDMALAALAGDKVYNFGELLNHPIFATIKSNWLGQLLAAVNVGDIATYERIVVANQADIARHPALAAASQTLREKVSILALMTLALGRSARDRTLSFADIAAATRLAANEVELLLMKALALALIRGTIDQVDETVSISWVQPRVLDAKQLDVVAARLQDWSQLVTTQLAALKQQMPNGLVQ